MKLEELLAENVVFYAHTRKEQKERETLREHTELCCAYFQKIFSQESYDDFWKRVRRLCKMENISIVTEKIIKDMWYAVPTFHDIGKINPAFQQKQMKFSAASAEEIKQFLGEAYTKHSLFSSVLYINTYAKKIKEMVPGKEERYWCIFFMFCNAYVIARHHSDFCAFGEFLDSFYEGGEASRIVKGFDSAYMKRIYREAIFLKTNDEGDVCGEKMNLLNIMKKVRESFVHEKNAPVFFTYVRLLSSILIASDYDSTTEFCDEIKTKMISGNTEIENMRGLYENSGLAKKIREYEEKSYGKDMDFGKIHDMNTMRNELFLDAEKSMLKHPEKNIYYLEAPTGSGKSNTAFQLSFLLQKKNHMEKIFYVYPFNTLVEQNYEILQNMFGNTEEVMENIAVINSLTPIKVKGDKHSFSNPAMSEKTQTAQHKQHDNKDKRNEMKEIEDNEVLYKTALLDRQFLNYPLILTTSVSLFQFLFSERQDSLMAFHKFQNSIIVLDEIQNYKNGIWTEIITFLDIFSEILNMKIVIMSATLPDLNFLIKGEHRAVRLITDRKKYFEHPIFAKRVLLHYDLIREKITLQILYHHLRRYQDSKKKILIEFITKKSAIEFYRLLKEKEESGELSWAELALMTGDDNQAERKRIIALTKEERKETSLILVATQVIEAGVDIDMEIGYKDLSLLDSEEQFLGRINRSYKGIGYFGEVWFFDLDDEQQVYKGDLRSGSELTIRKENMRYILEHKNFSDYYIPLMERLKQKAGEINENNIKRFFAETVGKLDFPQIAEHMKLLDEKQWKISIYFCRDIPLEDGTWLSGKEIWEDYKKLLKDDSMGYAKKKVFLSRVRSKMEYFIYEVGIKKGMDFCWNDQIGELYCVEDTDDYFVDGKFDAALFGKRGDLMI